MIHIKIHENYWADSIIFFVLIKIRNLPKDAVIKGKILKQKN